MLELIVVLTDAAGAFVMLMMFGFRWRALCMSDAVTTKPRTAEDWSGSYPSFYNRSRSSNDRAKCSQCLKQRSRSSVTRGSKGGV
jgi:hypothetical protein